MKSNQERSNESLPPKKRELPATSRPSEEKTVGLRSENHRTDNLPWISTTTSNQSSLGGRHHGQAGASPETGLQQGAVLHKSLSTNMDYATPSAPRSVPVATTVPALYQTTQSGASVSPVQYTNVPHTFHFIGPPYSGPYAGFIPSQLISPTSNSTSSAVSSASVTTPSQRSQMEAYSTLIASVGNFSQQGHKIEPHLDRNSGLISAGSPHTQPSQYVHISNSSQSGIRTLSPPTIPVHLHNHPTLALGPTSQVLLHYSDPGTHYITRDPTKKEESFRSQPKELLNGEIEKVRRFGVSPSTDAQLMKAGNNKPASQHFESRHVVVHPSTDYSTRDSSGVRTSVMVVPNSNTTATDMDVQQTIKRETSPSAVHNKGSLHLGKPAHRSYALSPQQTLCPEGVKTVTTLSPHTVIQTTHSAAEQLSVGLPAAAFYAGTQQPVIGYLSSQQQTIGYPGNLPQHLVIPGTQPLLIPVGNPEIESSGVGVAPAIVTSSPQFAAVPHTFVTTPIPKSDNYSAESMATQTAYQTALVPAQIHLPVVQSVASNVSTNPTLPPYFMKGSIIQLANGELKKVEDLKTEDFIQSADISTDLKIDSSTVERIDNSQSPGIAIVQFAVGEHRAQVSVEVFIEYPFFVFGQGWSSCSPERTSQMFDLPCSKLSVGDVCISLTLKNLKNGSIKKGQSMDSPSILLKHPKNDSLPGNRHRYAEHENGINQGSSQVASENGELRCTAGLNAVTFEAKRESGKPIATRKRRWSAPESRKIEKSEEEPPLTLPKPSFIPQEVKISIEGRSNVGK
ncbi:ataxin-1 [Bombina bombina]|uniref:ataxin-1 n=1 Tax=Bombina bombina TaxID=8345 RepID=UPI00235A94F1|nr:ataxin-1 [Bombina bombina]XP_053570742.1 ataxin-1 [Bombina bombina]XP_053570743.1 ataxin-1 [Bombina bombina]XP_053570744.1 ataxin-1 [Bombina bombina]XP_053570745.1 ataxin-1 [Bombina bombina]